MSASRQGMSFEEMEQVVAQRVAYAIEAIAIYKSKIRMAHDSMNQVVREEATDSALTWWNLHKRIIGTDAAYVMTWKELMKLMTEVYCPRNEIQKMENELWNLAVKGNDLTAYTQRFQELILLCTKMTPSCYSSCKKLDGSELKGYAARNAENKGRLDNNQRDNRVQQPPLKRQNVSRAYMVGNNKNKGYAGILPLCDKGKGHTKRYCQELGNQNGDGEARQNLDIVMGMKPKEPTYLVALDALALTTRYPAFLITAEVPVPSKAFDEPPTKEEALSFIRELGHTREIKYITNVIVDHLHQPWRTFASIINKCLCGKIDNIDSKKQDKMFYLRFTKIIIHHFLKKDKHAETQVYGAILPQAMTNQVVLDSVAYKTYYAIASGAEPPISRKSQKKSDSAISSEESPSKKKSTKAKKVAAPKPKPTKKKTLFKADRGKGLNVLSEVALSEAAQLKEATKRSKKDLHISQASGSGDGTDFESGVPDEQHLKTTGADERTGIIPGVPDVPKYDSESEKESWGDVEKKMKMMRTILKIKVMMVTMIVKPHI
ncbi:hypothetical protein Tco_0417053 [Tanacetum coccineum]